jgi:hypothetical protein
MSGPTSVQPSVRVSGPKSAVLLLAVWLAAAVLVSASGALQNIPSAIPLVLGFVAPASGYIALYFASARFRRFVLDQELRWVTLAQALRVCGDLLCQVCGRRATWAVRGFDRD